MDGLMDPSPLPDLMEPLPLPLPLRAEPGPSASSSESREPSDRCEACPDDRDESDPAELSPELPDLDEAWLCSLSAMLWAIRAYFSASAH